MKHLTGLLIITALVFQSCVRDADVELPENSSKTVLQGVMQLDSPAKVHLSRSQSSLENSELIPIENAQVRLLQNDNVVATLEHVSKGYYKSEGFLTEKTGSFTVEATRGESMDMRGTTNVPAPVLIRSAGIDYESFTNTEGEKLHELTVSLKDPGNRENYYEVIFRVKNDDSIPNRGTYYQSVNLVSNDPAVDHSSNKGQLLDDNIFNGQSYTLTFRINQNIPYSALSQNGVVILRTVSKAYYQYERKFAKQRSSSGTGIFASEPVIMYDNVKGGYGVFAGFSQDKLSF